jgi:hypothetical protein
VQLRGRVKRDFASIHRPRSDLYVFDPEKVAWSNSTATSGIELIFRLVQRVSGPASVPVISIRMEETQ